MAWVILLIAGALETVWALALKQSDGFTRLGPTMVFVVAGIASVVLLAFALRELPVGTGYAVWTGIARLVAIALIATGIVWLAVGDHRPA